MGMSNYSYMLTCENLQEIPKGVKAFSIKRNKFVN